MLYSLPQFRYFPSLLQLFLKLPSLLEGCYTDMKSRKSFGPFFKSNLKSSIYDFDSKDNLELQEQSGVSERTPLQDSQIQRSATAYLDRNKMQYKGKTELVNRLLCENVAMRTKIREIRKKTENLKKKYKDFISFDMPGDESTNHPKENEVYI